jgi:hypothetical protein
MSRIDCIGSYGKCTGIANGVSIELTAHDDKPVFDNLCNVPMACDIINIRPGRAFPPT